jgi:predicted outer membrane protein
MRRTSLLAAFAAVALFAAANALAQEERRPDDSERPGRAERPGAAPRPGAQPGLGGQNWGDTVLAGCLAISNQEEIALAEFARGKTKNAEVRQFAEMMIAEHTEFLNKLKKFAPDVASVELSATTGRPAGGRPGAAARPDADDSQESDRPEGDRPEGDRPEGDRPEGDRPEGDRPEGETPEADRPEADDPAAEDRPGESAQPDAETRPDAADDRPAAGQPGRQPRTSARPAGEQAMLDPLQLKRELAQECLTSTIEELGKKKGAEFDKCYMVQQVIAHQQMIATLHVFQRHASPELAELIAEGEKTAKKHLQHGKQLAKQMEQAYSQAASTQQGGDRAQQE